MKSLTPLLHRRLDESAGFDRVVEIIGSGSATDSGTTILAAKCRMLSMPCSAMSSVTRALVADIAGDERRLLRNRPGKPGREVVEHHDRLARIQRARAPCGCRYSPRLPSPEPPSAVSPCAARLSIGLTTTLQPSVQVRCSDELRDTAMQPAAVAARYWRDRSLTLRCRLPSCPEFPSVESFLLNHGSDQ